jgi:hypothetical protein
VCVCRAYIKVPEMQVIGKVGSRQEVSVIDRTITNRYETHKVLWELALDAKLVSYLSHHIHSMHSISKQRSEVHPLSLSLVRTRSLHTDGASALPTAGPDCEARVDVTR